MKEFIFFHVTIVILKCVKLSGKKVVITGDDHSGPTTKCVLCWCEEYIMMAAPQVSTRLTATHRDTVTTSIPRQAPFASPCEGFQRAAGCEAPLSFTGFLASGLVLLCTTRRVVHNPLIMSQNADNNPSIVVVCANIVSYRVTAAPQLPSCVLLCTPSDRSCSACSLQHQKAAWARQQLHAVLLLALLSRKGEGSPPPCMAKV